MRLIVQETATWCGPCQNELLARELYDHRDDRKPGQLELANVADDPHMREVVLRLSRRLHVALIAGLMMFAIAKWSVIRRGTIISFGPGAMTSSMRTLYFWGYATMGCASLLAAFYIAFMPQ